MKRIIIICEGETEKEFCLKLLTPYFAAKNIYIQAPLIKKSMGGIVKWMSLKKDVHLFLKNDKSAIVTTFIDYYGINAKLEFPNWEQSKLISDKNARMEFLEKSMYDDIDESVKYRFLPYLQLHEFEGLLFNDITIFYSQIPLNELIGVDELKKTFLDFSNPEMINDSQDTSPSHRLSRIIRGYNKIVYGNIIAEAIGLENIRQKSPRFNQWLKKIEAM